MKKVATVTCLETRASKIICAASADVRAIARMINEEGNRLIEDGLEASNVLPLVNTQLVRLIEGNICDCMNPNCQKQFSLEDFFKNPLAMTCSEDCTIQAVEIAASKIMENLRIEIPQIEVQMKKIMLETASSAVRKGDVVDRSYQQSTSAIQNQMLVVKKIRFNRLLDVMQAIRSGEFSTACADHAHCGEEIPLPTRLSAPEVGFCPACTEKRIAR